jgi:hypothetical protein
MPLRLVEINDAAWFPRAAPLAEEPLLLDTPIAILEDSVTFDVASFEPLLPIAESLSTYPATPDPTPVTTGLPGSIGLPNSSATGHTPFLTAPTSPDVWRGLWRNARRAVSIIVLPNLAPPG